MRWRGRRESENIDDRRSMGRATVAGGGGILGIIIVLVIIFMGGDPRPVMQEMQKNQPAQQSGSAPVDPKQDEAARFVSVILADTEDVWKQLFRQIGKEYQVPKLVLFSGSVQSACGFQSAATGPFYCPADQHVYLDLNFFNEMTQRLDAPGDFAQAYVIAHEIGHHVQKLLGVSDEVHGMQRLAGKKRANELSVRLELQADFYAGVWAHHAQQNWQILEEGDIEEALHAASAIGDDHLQKQARGHVTPDSFTHGTSEQRVRWFVRGLKTGAMDQGDTFAPQYSQL